MSHGFNGGKNISVSTTVFPPVFAKIWKIIWKKFEIAQKSAAY